MPFLTEPEPARAVAVPVAPGVRRIVAANPGPMTYRGTNTYIIETADAGTVVLDPGPDGHPDHVDAILRETGGRVGLILVSHHHHDHIGAVPALQQATGAPVAGFHVPATPEFAPGVGIEDGERIAGMTAIHTPGHAADHLCFALPSPGGGTVLFSADHVMSWSSTVVSPPGGDMAAYFASLERLLGGAETLYLPGHGPPLTEPRALVRELLEHRQARERAIAEALADGAPADTHTLMDQLYSQVDPRLRRAAERNVLAHLMKLQSEGRVAREGDLWRAA